MRKFPPGKGELTKTAVMEPILRSIEHNVTETDRSLALLPSGIFRVEAKNKYMYDVSVS